MIILWILVAIIMFSFIILIHEFGHFSAARKFWVKVEEFWLWIPPKAKELFKDKKWTLFTLNWLPLWWFVRLKWENPALLENKDDPEALSNKSYFAQSIIILWWVIMNFLLAIIIFSLLFFIWVQPIWINSQIQTNLNLKIIPTPEQALKSWLLLKNPWILLHPIKNSIAEKSWVQQWDILLKIAISSPPLAPLWRGELTILSPQDAINIISKSAHKKLIFIIKRQDKFFKIPIIPLPFEKQKVPTFKGGLGGKDWKIWSYLSENITVDKDFRYKYWIIDSIKYWTLETYNQSLLTFKAIWILIKKLVNPETPEERTEAIENMRGPIWIVDLVANSLEAWIMFIIIIWAIISINLWVFNLLPIPALDWWRFLFISINALISKLFWKKALTENLENYIHVFFFIILIFLSIIIWYNDVSNIINR